MIPPPPADARYRAVSRWRRALFTVLVLLTSAAGSVAFANIMADDGLRPLEALGCALYFVLSAWIAIGFWTALLGLGVRLFGRDAWALDPDTPYTSPSPGAEPGRRVALVMPVYNEDTARVCASLRAAHDELRELGADDDFDFYILSDSRSASARLEEALLFAELRRDAPPGFRLFYRRREKNYARKSGNIAEFCERWGARYDYMIVFDADSVVGGRTLRSLVAMMDRYPQAGIIQTPPVAANRGTLFARLHQFAASAYGPIFNAGQAFWCMGESNYLGHNAIIRVRPFMEHCGLAPLPGKAPLGGEILSHDFVEAGLMRRAGWQVWTAHGLAESFEEPPPTLLDYAKRDRRWCQGNVQHLRLLGLAGLRPITRLHFLFGGLSYMAGGVWLLFLAAMLLNAAAALPEGWIVAENGVLVPHWPLDRTADLVLLFGLTGAMLLLPKLLAVGLVLRDPAARRAHGGGVMPLLSALVETVVSILTTPILLLFHIRFIAEIVLGRSVGWQPQRRVEGGSALAEIARAHLGHTVIGFGLLWLTHHVAPSLFWWFAPVFLGLILAAPVSAATGSLALGRLARRLGLFLVPTEGRRRPPIYRRFDAHLHRLTERGRDRRLADAFADPALLRLAAAAFPEPAGTPAAGDGAAAIVDKVRADGLFALDDDERLAALADPAIRRSVHRSLWLDGSGDGRAA